ncbi:histidinol-phosphatase [Carboxylicivirga taeanensis]|uniref:histidinol-phosphatase n=1 Tax=Carboxylicivirga taeanensis TaxID=1416875 RepID=UPI003F6E2A23
MQYFSYHTHTLFCDGKAGVEEICQRALALNMSAIGFSSHAPLPFETAWAMKFENLLSYVAEVASCKEKYKGQLHIYRSLEADYLGEGLSLPFNVLRKLAKLDYILGAVHLVANPNMPNEFWFLDGPSTNYEQGLNQVFGGDVRAAVEQYYWQMRQMVLLQKPDVVAHMDKVVMNDKKGYFSESDAWYQQAVEDTLQVIAASGAIVEVNTRGIYRGKYHTWFPNRTVIERCIELDIPLTISVDAHHVDELVSGFHEALLMLKEAGCRQISVFKERSWKQIPIDDVVSDK